MKRPPEAEYALATEHRGMAILFGDGAGALVLGKSTVAGHGLLGVQRALRRPRSTTHCASTPAAFASARS